MSSTCTLTVCWVTTSSSAIARLVYPGVTKAQHILLARRQTVGGHRYGVLGRTVCYMFQYLPGHLPINRQLPSKYFADADGQIGLTGSLEAQ